MRKMSPTRSVKLSPTLPLSQTPLRMVAAVLLTGLALVMILGPGLQLTAADDTFPQNYRFADLDKLDGTASCSQSRAIAVNNIGQVAGHYYTDNCVPHAFMWTDINQDGQSEPGEMIDLGTLTGGDANSQSIATGINNNGDVVGYSMSQQSASGFPRAFLYNGIRMTDLGTLRKDNTGEAVALGINDSGQILVVASADGGQPNEFPGPLRYGIFANGQKTDLGIVSGLNEAFFANPDSSSFYTFALGGINKFGHVAGTLVQQNTSDGCGPTAFYYDGQVHPISHDCSFVQNASYAAGINNSDQLVVTERTSFTSGVAFIYANGVRTTIPGAGPINNSGQVIYNGSDGGHIYSGGIGYRLPQTTKSNGQIVGMAAAFGLNDVGQIVGGGFGTGHALLMTPVSTNSIQFAANAFSAGESGNMALINVVRTGDTSDSASVSYMTTNSTAKEGTDYVAAFGVLKFASGEGSKTFPLLIIDNGFVDGARTINLTLSSPSGASLGSPSSAVLTIADNDSFAGPNPLDTARTFVQLHYYDFFGRFPDSSGWDFWTSQITNCGSNTQCLEVLRINVSAAFYVSIEFQNTGYLVERIYKVAYADADGTSTINGTHSLKVPIVRLNEFLPDTEKIGAGVIVGQAGWETVLENNKQAFTQEFVQRTRFTSAFPTTLSPAEFVDKLFTNGGVTPSSAERAAAINEFSSAADTTNVAARARALRDVAENQTFTTNEFNRAFVLMQYFGYLRRNPNDPPDTDYTGYDFWLTKLNQFNGDYINAEMVKAFISATEYRHRFAP